MVEDLLEDLLVSPPEEVVEAFIEHLVVLEVEEQLSVKLDCVEKMRRKENIGVFEIVNEIVNLGLRSVVVVDVFYEVVEEAFCLELAVDVLDAALVEEDHVVIGEPVAFDPHIALEVGYHFLVVNGHNILQNKRVVPLFLLEISPKTSEQTCLFVVDITCRMRKGKQLWDVSQKKQQIFLGSIDDGLQ